MSPSALLKRSNILSPGYHHRGCGPAKVSSDEYLQEIIIHPVSILKG